MKRTKLGRYVQEITQAELESLFHLPSEQACLQLRIGLTMLKRVCRRFGIHRWPYCRKGSSAGSTPPARGRPSALVPAKRRVQQGQPAGLEETEAPQPPSSAQHSASQQQPRGSQHSIQAADTQQQHRATAAAAKQGADVRSPQHQQQEQEHGSSPKGSSLKDSSRMEASRPLRAARLKVVSYALGSDDWELSESEADSPHAPPAGQARHKSEGSAHTSSPAASQSTGHRGRPASPSSLGRGAAQGGAQNAALEGIEGTGLSSSEAKQLTTAVQADRANSVTAPTSVRLSDTGGRQQAAPAYIAKAAAELAGAGFGKAGRPMSQLRARRAPYARLRAEWQLQPAAMPVRATVQAESLQQQHEKEQQQQQPRSHASSRDSASRQASASGPFPGDGFLLQRLPVQQQGAGDALSPVSELLPTAFGASALPETPRLLGPTGGASLLCQGSPSTAPAAQRVRRLSQGCGVVAGSPTSAHKSPPRCAQPLRAQFSSASSGLPWQPASPALGSSPAHSKANPVAPMHSSAQDTDNHLLAAVLEQELTPNETGHAAMHAMVGRQEVGQPWAALGDRVELDSAEGARALGMAGSAGTAAAAGGCMLLAKSFGSWLPLGTPKGHSPSSLLADVGEKLSMSTLLEAAPTWLEGIDFVSDTSSGSLEPHDPMAADTSTTPRIMGSAGLASSGSKPVQPLLPQKTDLAAIQRLALEHAQDPSDPTKASLAHKVLLHLSSLDSSTTLQGLPWHTQGPAQGASSYHDMHAGQSRHASRAQPATLTRAADLVRADSWRSAGEHEVAPAPAPTQAAGAPWQAAPAAPVLSPAGCTSERCHTVSAVSAHTLSHHTLAGNPRYKEQGAARLGHSSCRPSLPPLPSQLVLWGQRPAGTAGFEESSHAGGNRSSTASVDGYQARPAAGTRASPGPHHQGHLEQFGLLTQPQQPQHEQEQEQERYWDGSAELGDLLRFWEADEFTLQLPCSGVGSVVPGPTMASLSPSQTTWLASA
ncbi:hypothetical protein N2152v2_002695 [Parachlorella kessleri]|uniref:RWP-RK transcription factor n=1 Tax=Parachlorella kessleri TaxID=3074 RepID=A0A292GD30_PARKE|nr:RWP-RK transcription factor [Parachlorella kessleri]